MATSLRIAGNTPESRDIRNKRKVDQAITSLNLKKKKPPRIPTGPIDYSLRREEKIKDKIPKKISIIY